VAVTVAAGVALGVSVAVAGAVVALVIAKTGTDILRESAAELMDTVPDRQMEGQIRSVLSSFPQIRSTESIHTHRFGPYYMANLTVGINGGLTVSEGDAIADAVEKRLGDEVDLLRRVYIHYHPAR